jgi:hypothetical protein
MWGILLKSSLHAIAFLQPRGNYYIAQLYKIKEWRLWFSSQFSRKKQAFRVELPQFMRVRVFCGSIYLEKSVLARKAKKV